MQKITTFLTFNDKAEEAVNLYTSVFKNSKIHSISRYGEAGPLPAGTVLTISFQLDGQDFVALNGGPHFSFCEGISLYVDCETQQEVDELWEKLSEGGEKQQCGWLKDRYGVSWQIIPKALVEMMQDEDPKKAESVTRAMLQMTKIEIDTLRQAYERS